MADERRVFSKGLASALAGLVLFLAVGELILFTFSDGGPPHYSPLALNFVYLSGFIITPLLMFLGTKYPSFKLPAMIWFQLTMGVLLLWFSEIFSPFTAVWSIMILFASLYYGWKGFIGSSAFLAVIGILYCVLFSYDLKPNVLIYTVLATMVVVMTIFMSYLFVRIIMNSNKKNQDLLVAQQSERLQVNRQNTLLNSISDAVMTLNRYGRITSQNAAAQAFFDTNQSLIGKDIDTLLRLKDKDGKATSVHELISNTKTTTLRDDLSVGEGGDEQHLSIQMSRIRSTFDDNEEYGVVLIIRDITKQKSLEEEKDEFISVASHELRTPVAIAEGSLSNLLVMDDKNVKPEALRAAAKTAYDQIIYLSNIINDLSTLSRAERGVGDGVEDVDVNELLHKLFGKYQSEAREKGLRFDLDIEGSLPKVETSQLYLEEIMQNFVTNSLKYTKAGSITIRARLLPNGRIECSVSDTGIGISKTDMGHIFERFYRSEDYRTRETNGTGLGLYVVAKLSAKLGTKVNVVSRLNHGSTFSFEIPLRSAKLAGDRAPSVETIEEKSPSLSSVK